MTFLHLMTIINFCIAISYVSGRYVNDLGQDVLIFDGSDKFQDTVSLDEPLVSKTTINEGQAIKIDAEITKDDLPVKKATETEFLFPENYGLITHNRTQISEASETMQNDELLEKVMVHPDC
uniref:Secreted protein n=1 Tax=Rhabditophanes sp. KR3021 TaxID=114890 RepID=A0AC35TIL1_9BILA